MNKEEIKEQAKGELESAAINGIYQILTHLTSFYERFFDDDFELNEQFLKVFSALIGDVIGHFPDARHEELLTVCQKEIQQAMVLTAGDLAMEKAMMASTSPEEAAIAAMADKILEKFPKTFDLKDLTPKGSC